MRLRRNNSGFTIVELLIVIVVIAILAAITIVAYNGIQTRARASQASTALAQAKKKLEMYKVDNSGYPTTANLAAAGVTDNDTIYQYTSDGTTYCLTATAATVSYYLNSTTQSIPAAGGCAGHGQGGVAAITNIVTNPSAFSSVSSWSGWGGNGGGVVSTTSVAAAWATRGRAARNTWTTSNTTANGDLGWLVTSAGGPSSLEPNTQYTASWKVNASKVQNFMPYVGNWAALGAGQGTGTGVSNATNGNVTVTPGSPMLQWITFTSGANTYGAKVYAALTTGSTTWNAGDYIEVSDFMIVKGGTVYQFADGNSANWAWSGTANSSVSSGPPL